MAKQVKDKTEQTGIKAEDLKRVIAEAIRQKKQASEYAGMHGKVVANAVEQYGIEKTAFTLSRRLSEMEEGRRASVVRSCLDYWHKLGMFDQMDAFNDVAETLKAILADIEAGKGKSRTRDGDIRLAFAQ